MKGACFWLLGMAFLTGLPLLAAAHIQTAANDTLYVQATDTTFTGRVENPVVLLDEVKTVTLDGVTADEKMIVRSGCTVNFTFKGKNSLSGFENAGKTTWLYPEDENVKISARVMNAGEFDDQTSRVIYVDGPAGFSLTKMWAIASASPMNQPFYGIGYEGSYDETYFVTPTCNQWQMWNEETKEWENEDAVSNRSSIAPLRSSLPFEGAMIGMTRPGKYRLKIEADNSFDGDGTIKTTLYTRPMNLEAITGDITWKDKIFDALSICPQEKAVVSFNNVQAYHVDGGRCAVAIPFGADVTMNLTGTNSGLDSLVVGGKLLLTHEGTTQFSNTKICNNGIFTDSTGTVKKVYGPAGLLIDTLYFDTEINSVRTIWHFNAFFPKVSMEIYTEGLWKDFMDPANEAMSPQSLRSSDKEWVGAADVKFSTPNAGTYRIKYRVKKDGCETTVYSKAFQLTDSEGTITDDQKDLGKADAQTMIPSLAINAGKAGVVEASLTNISVAKSEVGAPSVTVAAGSNVKLTLKGVNDLGTMEIKNDAQIVLLPGETMENLVVNTVRNGGVFEDQTATVSRVEDLNGQVMVAFTDTSVVQYGEITSVTLKAFGNSIVGEYRLSFGESPEKWNEVEKKWEDYDVSNLKSIETLENPDHSSFAAGTISVKDPGVYRLKVISRGFGETNKDMKAILYCVFELREIEPTEITGDQELGSLDTSTQYDMLVFHTEDKETIHATLNNVKVDSYVNVSSTVVMEGEDVAITLNGTNDLGYLDVMDNAKVVLSKGNRFEGLSAIVTNAGHFTDETGTITAVKDSRGHTMVNITEVGRIEALSQFYIKIEFNSMEGYLTTEEDVFIEKWSGSKWEQTGDGLTPETMTNYRVAGDGIEASGKTFIARTVTEPGSYRFRVLSKEWLNTDSETGKSAHTATLYQYFTIAAPITYYSINLPAVTGATTSPAAGWYTEEEGSSFSFTLTLDVDYDQSKPEVKANGKVLTPDANGRYVIESISEDITISITGVTQNLPTANAEVEGNGVKVWGVDGKLHLSLPTVEHVWIYGFSGTLVRALGEISGDVSVDLARGSYVIVVGEERYKLSL